MPVTRVVCPSCQAGLKSAAGFRPGQKLRCPKCQGIVTVPAPVVEVLDDEDDAPPRRPAPKPLVKKRPVAAIVDDDDEDEDDDRPVRKKKKKKKGGSYKSSPLRFAILGVLLLVMGVLGYFLFLKKSADKEAIAHNERVKAKQSENADDDEMPAQAIPKGVSRPARDPAQDRMSRLATAMHNVVIISDDANSLPPAVFTRVNDQPGLSWRVALLPFLEQKALFDKFKLDEPWDSPHNMALIPQMPSAFASPGGKAQPGETYYKVFTGGGAWFDLKYGKGSSKLSPPDGASNTILIVEGGDPVIWTKPEDIPYDPAKPLPNLTPPDGGTRLTIAMGDGSTRAIDLVKLKTTPLEKSFRAAITSGAGDLLGPEWFDSRQP